MIAKPRRKTGGYMRSYLGKHLVELAHEPDDGGACERLLDGHAGLSDEQFGQPVEYLGREEQ